MTVEKAFGIVLKKAREMRAMTQVKLAEKSDLDVTFISLLERGHRQPSLKSFFNLSAALEMSPVELMKKTLKELASQR